MADRAKRAGAAPELYWRAPKDSAGAFFDHSYDPAHYGGIHRRRCARCSKVAGEEKIGKPADREALADLLSLPISQGPSVSARRYADAPPAAAQAGKPTPNEALDKMMGASSAGTCSGSRRPDALIKYVKNAVAAYNTPGLRKRLRRSTSIREDLPTVKNSSGTEGAREDVLAVEIQIVRDLPPLDGDADSLRRQGQAEAQADDAAPPPRRR